MLVLDILMLKRVMGHNFDAKKVLDAIILTLKRVLVIFFGAKN